jgi:hypothetical protein
MTYCLVNHLITDHLVLVHVTTEWDYSVDNPTSCEICAFMRFKSTVDIMNYAL